MPGKYCCVCKNNLSKDPQVFLHRFPSDKEKCSKWLEVFQIKEDQLKPHMRVCSRHFPDGDASKAPNLSLEKRFCSPCKKTGSRAKRAEKRRSLSVLSTTSPSLSPCSSRSETPAPSVASSQLQPSESLASETSSSYGVPPIQQQTSVMVHTALLARIEFLESQNASLRKATVQMSNTPKYFRIEQIYSSDKLMRFYTGFMSYNLFLSFWVQ